MKLEQRQHIDYQPHSRPKRFYIIESQFRSGVKGSTFTDIYDFHYRRYPKTTALTAFIWLLVMIGYGIGVYYLIFG